MSRWWTAAAGVTKMCSVEQRELEQWSVRITDYSEELLQGLNHMDGWPEKVRTMQRNWIGRSEGANVDFTLDGGSQTKITVFTTRIDTIYGATSVQLAPQHPLVAELVGSDSRQTRQPGRDATGRTRAWKAPIVSRASTDFTENPTRLAPGESRDDNAAELTPEARKVLRKLHQTIQRITDDFQGRWHFNTSVAAMMELLNACMVQQDLFAAESAAPKAFRADVQRKLILLLNPFAPYLAAELWSTLGEDANALLRHPWPQADPVLAKEDEVEIVVQFNGKVRSRLTVAHDADDESVREDLALADEKVIEALAGKQIMKVIVVKNKLVNIVIKG